MYTVILLLGYLPIGLAMYLSAAGAGISMMGYWDTVSFIIVPFAPYCIAAGVTKKFSLDEDGLKLFGDLCVGFAIVGTLIGFIMMFYGLSAVPSENFTATLFLSLAIALMTMLYGFAGKYLIALPMIACKKNC